jgi:hypothetical protein
MRSVTDRNGKQWHLDITVLTVERVKSACKIDMPGLFGDKMAALDALLFDPVFPQVIFECCRDRGDLTLEALKEVWNGEFADLVIEAWLEELIGFFPNARKRESLRNALTALREINTRIVEGSAKMMTPEAVEQTVASALSSLRLKSPETSTEPSGSLPDTSPSTLDLSPSGS